MSCDVDRTPSVPRGSLSTRGTVTREKGSQGPPLQGGEHSPGRTCLGVKSEGLGKDPDFRQLNQYPWQPSKPSHRKSIPWNINFLKRTCLYKVQTVLR